MDYDIGDTVRLYVTAKDIDKEDSDPTTVALKIKDPADSVTAYTYALGELTKLSTGVYYRNYKFSASGKYHVRWETTGTPEQAEEKTYIVRTSNVV